MGREGAERHRWSALERHSLTSCSRSSASIRTTQRGTPLQALAAMAAASAEGVSLAGLLEESGPGADAPALLARLPPPTDRAVAEVAGLLTASPSTWDAEALGSALRAAAPSLSLLGVAQALQAGALPPPPSPAGLLALVSFWHGLSGGGAFPVDVLLGGAAWPRADAHAAVLRHALAAPPGLLDWTAGPGAETRTAPPPGVPASSPWLRADVYATLAALARAGAAREAAAALEGALRTHAELAARGVARAPGGWGDDAAPRGDCLQFLEARLDARADPPLEVLVPFLRVLAAHAHALPPASHPALERVRRGALRRHPGLAADPALGDEARAPGPDSPPDGPFGEEVEAEANATFQRVYTEALPVATLVAELARMAGSAERRERRLYDCVVHNLFDEYRFLARYPDRELELTGELWGRVMAARLVTGAPLAVAQRHLLDALGANAPGSRMHAFGLRAARALAPRLPDWPEFAAQLAEAPGLDPALRAAATSAARGGGDGGGDGASSPGDGGEGAGAAGAAPATSAPAAPAAPAGGPRQAPDGSAGHLVPPAQAAPPAVGPASAAGMSTPVRPARPAGAAQAAATPSTPADPGALFAAINADALEAAVARDVDYPVPDPALADRVGFIFNNLTRANLDGKLVELRRIVTPDLYPWFVTYTTVQRAAQEANQQDVYVAVVDGWGDRALAAAFVRSSIKYVRVILDSRAVIRTSERTLLRNLASFLGKQTLAKNKPVLQRDLDLKELMLSAYETGRLHPILCFVRSLLEVGLVSRVFRPPNPWFMGLLALMAEVYKLPGLRNSIVFEVELLFKAAGLVVADVAPSALLGARRAPPPDSADFGGGAQGPGVAATPDRAFGGGGGAAAATGAGYGAGGGAADQQQAAAALAAAQASAAAAARAPASAAAASGGGQASAPAASGTGADPALLEALASRVVVGPRLEQYERLGLRAAVLGAAERAVRDVIDPVVERARTISCVTGQALVLKDYAEEPDAEVVRRAAALAVRGLASALALVTAREPLRVRLAHHLSAALPGELDPGLAAALCEALVADNLDAACGVVEGTAAARAVAEADARLAAALAPRRAAAAAGAPWPPPPAGDAAPPRFPAALPESLRPAPAARLGHAARVYEEFARIPREAEEAGGARGGGAPGAASSSAASAAASNLRARFSAWVQRMDLAVAAESAGSAPPRAAELRALAGEAGALFARDDVATALDVARAVLARALAPGASRLHAGAYVAALEAVRGALEAGAPGGDAAPLRAALGAELARGLLAALEEGRPCREAAEALMGARLLPLPEFDVALARALGGPRGGPAADVALGLLQASCLGGVGAGAGGAAANPGAQPPPFSAHDLAASADSLLRVAARLPSGPTVVALVGEARRLALLRAVGAPGGLPGVAALGPDDPRDAPAAVEAAMKSLDRWVRVLEEEPRDDVHAAFVVEARAAGVVTQEGALTGQAARIMAQLAVQHCLRSEVAAAAAAAAGAAGRAALSFVAVDALARLVACLAREHGGGAASLGTVLDVLAAVLLKDADERGAAFNGRPYFRLVVGLVAELGAPEAGGAAPGDGAGRLDATPSSTALEYLEAVAAFLFAVRPQRAPAFAFSWLQLVGERRFMPRLLSAPGQAGWGPLLQLILSQLEFLEPLLGAGEQTDAVRQLYRGTLRVLLVTLHDFPEFLCEYATPLASAVPSQCVQLRNLVLSAFPRSMHLPDPFTTGQAIAAMPETEAAPRGAPVPETLLPAGLRAAADAALGAGGAAAEALPALLSALGEAAAAEPAPGARARGNPAHRAVATLGVYLVLRGSARDGGAKDGAAAAPPTPHLDLLAGLAGALDPPACGALLDALANQLRYPSAHTAAFSVALLGLFARAPREAVAEQLTRVLLERLIATRPHPWGLLVTFIELLKDPRYDFWSHAFTRCAPDIERLFESMSRSAMGPGGGAPPHQAGAASEAAAA
ncbi:NOT1 [Auxenochlorella protothecoides x Auxenochlorella symbiontica]